MQGARLVDHSSPRPPDSSAQFGPSPPGFQAEALGVHHRMPGVVVGRGVRQQARIRCVPLNITNPPVARSARSSGTQKLCASITVPQRPVLVVPDPCPAGRLGEAGLDQHRRRRRSGGRARPRRRPRPRAPRTRGSSQYNPLQLAGARRPPARPDYSRLRCPGYAGRATRWPRPRGPAHAGRALDPAVGRQPDRGRRRPSLPPCLTPRIAAATVPATASTSPSDASLMSCPRPTTSTIESAGRAFSRTRSTGTKRSAVPTT